MNATRIGKIARLPEPVREALNRRLQNGESGSSLCAWLHALPEVRAVLAREFGGRPINAQNLTEWRQGGFHDWQAVQEARLLAKELGQEMLAGPEAECQVPIETLVLWLTGRYAVATQRVERAADPDERWRLLRQMCHDVLRLRQGDLSLKRLELEQQWRELRNGKSGKDEKNNAPVSKNGGDNLGSHGGQPHAIHADPTPASAIFPAKIAPIRSDTTRVIQADSNQFKPLKVPGTQQAPLAGPISPPPCRS